MAKTEWQFHSMYRGCRIEHRPGHQRRGWCSTYHNWYNPNGRIGSYIHHSLENARSHIDKLHKDLGDKIALKEGEV